MALASVRGLRFARTDCTSVMTDRTRSPSPPARDSAEASADAPHVVPVVEETVHVGRERNVTGRVRVTKHVSARVVPVDVAFARERVRVTRQRIDRPVDAVPPVRQEGDTLVVPVVEERVVVEKRLFLLEEIRLTRVHDVAHARKRVRVRSEHVDVERLDAGGEGGDDDTPSA
jgi:uncharacterized protein (TIGR02271 family)